MCGIQPDDAAAPTKAGDRQTLGVTTICGGPFRGGIQIAHDLCIRHFVDDLGKNLGVLSELGWIALACIHFGGDRKVTQFCETSANIFDVLMHAENFLHNQNGAKIRLASRGCAVRRDGAVGDGDLDFAGDQAVGVRRDHGLRHHGASGERKTAH